MAFKMAKRVSDVTESYIRKSLMHHYPHINKAEWSDKLVKRFHADFHNKALQNRWFFGDKVRVYLEIPPKKLAETVKKKDSVKRFCAAIESYGFSTSDPELFVQGKVTKNKQVYKISAALNEIRKEVNEDSRLLAEGIIIKAFHSKPKTVKGQDFPDEITGDITTDTSLLKLKRSKTYKVLGIVDDVLLIQNENGDVIPTPKASIKRYELPPTALDIDIYSALEEVKASNLTISQDINDYITASSGAFSSCFTIGKSYHFGWQQMWRTPFVWIAFTEKEQFYKTGRMWIMQNLTAMNEPIDKRYRAVRFQKSYGQVRDAQKNSLMEFIQQRFNQYYKGTAKFQALKTSSGDLTSKFISQNILGGWGRHAGYFDTGGDLTAYDNSNPFASQPLLGKCMFMFADALDIRGNVTTNSNFGTEGGNRGMVGVYPESVIVESVVSKRKVDSNEAIQLSDGTWVSRSDVEALLNSTTPVITPKEEELTEEPEVAEVAVGDLDVEDF